VDVSQIVEVQPGNFATTFIYSEFQHYQQCHPLPEADLAADPNADGSASVLAGYE
jgi:hypothetical protein